MAKGNMLLGYSRGSVGDVTFYRSGGSQRQRARNRQPNNPRTARQMTQRSVFANAVKFFKQLNSGFFRFAYEDKKTNESDYNAFMRHNIKNSGYIGAQASKIANWPALGNWQLSEGSLPQIYAPFPQPSNNGLYFDLGVTFTPSSIPTTIGELTEKLITDAPEVWRVGDIITVVVYQATNAAKLPTTDTDTDTRAIANYAQFILNTSDETTLASINIKILGTATALDLTQEYLGIIGDDDEYETIFNRDLIGAAVIHSRNTSTGLQVSSSYLAFNKQGKIVDAMLDSGEYYSAVLADWQASQDAILQGAAAKGAAVFRVIGVEDYNTGTQFTLGNDGVWRAPLSLMTAQGAYIMIRAQVPNYIPLSGISISPLPTGLTWNIAEPYSPEQFEGLEVINELNRTGAWTASRYTVTLGDNTVIFELTA